MKEIIENNINNLYVKEFNLEKNIKLKSLIIMYSIMTRSSNIYELKNILISLLKNDNNFRTNNEFYTNIIIKYALSIGYNSKTILNNYINNGYYFHSTNGAFEKYINNNGLILKNKPWNIKDIELIKSIFSKYGKKDIFGLYKGEEETPIFLSSSLSSSSYYAISSPTWFLHFVSGGMKNNNDKEAYRNRNYDSCLKNILNLIKEYNLTEEESKIVLDFFDKYYKILGLNTKPIILLIKRKNLKEKINIENKNTNETEFEYIKRILNEYCSKNIILLENIEKDDLTIINYITDKVPKKSNYK